MTNSLPCYAEAIPYNPAIRLLREGAYIKLIIPSMNRQDFLASLTGYVNGPGMLVWTHPWKRSSITAFTLHSERKPSGPPKR